MATKKKNDKKKTVKKPTRKKKTIAANQPSSSFVWGDDPTPPPPMKDAPSPTKPEEISANPSLLYGVIVDKFMPEMADYIAGSQHHLEAHEVDSKQVVAAVCLQKITGTIYMRNEASPEHAHALREFCKKCKVKFHSQWIFTWL